MNAPPQRAQMVNLDASMRPKLPNGLLATCAMVCALAPGPQGGPWQHMPLPTTRCTVSAKCQLSQAFVTMELHCSMPMTWPAAHLEFVLPKTSATTITELTIDNLEQGKLYATAVVPLEEIEKKGWGSNASIGPPGYQAPDPVTANPELFRLTLPYPAKPGDQLKVTLTYFHPLEFEQGSYLLRLPTEIPAQAVPPGTLPQHLLDVTVTLLSGTAAPITHVCPSGHRWVTGLQQPGMCTLSLARDAASSSPNADVVLGYKVWGSEINIALNVCPPRAPTPNDPDPRGAFVVSVSPPTPEATMRAGRSVVFILDRSGSMDGEPMQYAKAALQFGLSLLGQGDEFNVVAFDHEQMWYSPNLVPWGAQAAQACQAWIQSQVEARGLTDIMGPIQASMQLLQAARGIPYMFLITDGCVADERQICFMMEQACSAALAQVPAEEAPKASQPARLIPRLSTFAIGPFCNHYFLKQLATYGRGAFDVAFRPHAIQSQVQRMLTAAQLPVLSDITISLPGITSCELYPFPIPDLFCGMPVVIAGKFDGVFPEAITINGRLPDGTAWSSTPTRASKDMGLPLDKIFIKSRLDLMTARAWLQDNPQPLVSSIVDLSVATGVPCAYTRTVGFETTPAQYQQLQAQRAQQGGKKLNIAAFAIGGAAGIAILAGVGAAVAFGDVGSTIANISGDVLGGLGDVGGCCDGGCCDVDCGDCCDNCDIGDCVEGLGDACVIS